MGVGFPADKSAIDTRAGSLAVQLRETLEDVGQFQAFLSMSTTTDTYLTGLGYNAADISLLRAAFTALDALRMVALGQRTVPVADNFLFNSAKLTGVN